MAYDNPAVATAVTIIYSLGYKLLADYVSIRNYLLIVFDLLLLILVIGVSRLLIKNFALLQAVPDQSN